MKCYCVSLSSSSFLKCRVFPDFMGGISYIRGNNQGTDRFPALQDGDLRVQMLEVGCNTEDWGIGVETEHCLWEVGEMVVGYSWQSQD